jgi:hypothetical protein
MLKLVFGFFSRRVFGGIFSSWRVHSVKAGSSRLTRNCFLERVWAKKMCLKKPESNKIRLNILAHSCLSAFDLRRTDRRQSREAVVRTQKDPLCLGECVHTQKREKEKKRKGLGQESNDNVDRQKRERAKIALRLLWELETYISFFFLRSVRPHHFCFLHHEFAVFVLPFIGFLGGCMRLVLDAWQETNQQKKIIRKMR